MTSERKTFIFPDETVSRLEYLRKVTRMSSAADVVRLALIALEEQVKFIVSGGSMHWSKDGIMEPYSPLLDQNAIKQAHSGSVSSINGDENIKHKERA